MSENTSFNKIIFFDDECVLCNNAVKYIIHKDKHSIFRFAALNATLAQNIKNTLNLHQSYNASIIVWDTNSKKGYLKGEALKAIIKHLDINVVVKFIISKSPLFITNIIYAIISKYRYKIFGKQEQCNLYEVNKYKYLMLK